MKSTIKASSREQVTPKHVRTEARRQQPQEVLCSLAGGTEAREQPCSGPGGGQGQAPPCDVSARSAHLPPGHGPRSVQATQRQRPQKSHF